MNDLIDWPAIRLVDRREGAVGGIPEPEEVRHDVVVGDTQDRAGLLLADFASKGPNDRRDALVWALTDLAFPKATIGAVRNAKY